MRNFARLWSIARGNKPKNEKNLILPARYRGFERLPERVQRHQPPHQGEAIPKRSTPRASSCTMPENGARPSRFCRTSKTTTREPARPTRFRSTSPAPISRTAVTTRPRSCSTPTAAPSAAVLSSKMPKGCTPCFYYLSPSPQRDQTVTGQAIVAISEFMSRYPDSEKYGQFEQMRNELTGRLHDKEFLNAYTYYKIGKHKSAIVALKNALRKYPRDAPPRRADVSDRRFGLRAGAQLGAAQADRPLSLDARLLLYLHRRVPRIDPPQGRSTAWPKRRRIIWLRIKKNDTQDGN